MARIVVLTGAGISAESGLGTFRDKDGAWTKFDLNEVATPEGFAADPSKVHHFYNMRRKNAVEASPNAAHTALARMEEVLGDDLRIITQNVDSLHEAAGSKRVWHMHGQLNRAKCASCGARWDAPLVMHPSDPCPACGQTATRPDIVWFGEMPEYMDQIWDVLRGADLFAAIGTSGNVYPAAAFVQDAARAGAHTVELNLEPSATVSDFAETRFGPATEIVPLWVEEELARLC